MTFAISALEYTVLAAAIASGGTLWQAARREARAEARYPPTGEIVTLAAGEFAGARVHIDIRGPEAAPQIVLIHGASGSLRDMTFRLAPALERDYRLFIVDRPGFGWSDPLKHDSIFRQARLLQAATSRLGARQPLIVGHSYGGAVALAWASEAPESLSGLVLLAAASQEWHTPLPWLYRLTAPALGQALAVPVISAWAPDGAVSSAVEEVFAPEAMPEGYIAHFGPQMTLRHKTMRANARQRANLETEIRQMVPRYQQIHVPVELLHGDRDTIVDLGIHSRPTQALLPQAQLTVLQGAGHMINHTRLDAVLAAIRRIAP
ncbi:alpha/beta hydrolase [Thioclava sp. GXIMD4216]|uniref:alpha/beta fold hydrolase n=1 Tax=Thioclava sp. GXIMD4216 TaxID=3131929 RepID=UPI0030D53808